MPNLVLGRRVFPEVVLDDCTPDAVAAAAEPLLRAPGAYAAALETRGLIILRQKTAMTQILPKRSLSAETLSDLRRLLRNKMGRRANLQEAIS